MANVVLVHGAVADGSSWRAVYESLKHSGHVVRIVQNPGTSLAADVAATLRVLDEVDGPVVLVGHSYGGVVITEAGNDPRVKALVYLAAFALDKGESIAALTAQSPSGEPPPFVVSKDGFLSIDKQKFHPVVCADLDASQASFLVDAQLPVGPGAIGGTVNAPAWKSKPSWYLVATEDAIIPPAAQRQMAARAGSTVTEIKGSHAIYISQPEATARFINAAAAAVGRGGS